MVATGIDKVLFSSTAAVYGAPEQVPIVESHPLRPLNPYGQSKYFVEQMLFDFARAKRLRSIILRYFNAAGADPDNEIGEVHDPETHLIPRSGAAVGSAGGGLGQRTRNAGPAPSSLRMPLISHQRWEQ